MKRMLWVAVGVLAALPVAAVATPGNDRGEGPPPHAQARGHEEVRGQGGAASMRKATGGVHDLAPAVSLSFNAMQRGGVVKGNVNYRTPTGTLKGRVTACYASAGSTAWFAGTVRKSDGLGDPTHFKVTVEDRGQGEAAPPDRFGIEHGATPYTCEVPGPLPHEADEGNLKVR